MLATETRTRYTGAILLILAGGLAVLSGVLGWATFTFPRTATLTRSIRVGHSTLAIVLGLFLVLRGVLAATLKDPVSARRWGVLGVLGGLLLGGFAVYDLATEKSRAVAALASNTARSIGVPVGRVRPLIDQQVAKGIVRLTFDVGIYLALAAGVLALAGAAVTWLGSRRESRFTGFFQPSPEDETVAQGPERTTGLNLEDQAD